jgi:hypothetical protein
LFWVTSKRSNVSKDYEKRYQKILTLAPTAWQLFDLIVHNFLFLGEEDLRLTAIQE